MFFRIILLFHIFKFINCEDEDYNYDNTIIDSHIYREPGCPLIAERHGFNITKIEGEWFLVYASISTFADLGHALLMRHPTVSEIKRLCPALFIKSRNPSPKDNTTWTLSWTFKNVRDTLDLRCWPQRETSKSKFECFFSKENIHTYIMMAATDHASWLLYVRCKIGVNPNQPGEGMSWSLLSRDQEIHPDVAQVAFGLLEGYGFDLRSHKFGYAYTSNC